MISINLILYLGMDRLLTYQRQLRLDAENRRRQAAVVRLLHEGQSHLVAGDYEGAISGFQELLALSPSHQEAQEGLSQAKRMIALASLYEQAIGMIEGERWEEALGRLEQITNVKPNYKDVAQQMAFVKRRIKLANLFREAEELYQASDWQGAAAKYEGIRRIALNYQKHVVEDRLFDCYLNRGVELVITTEDSAEPVREALALFERALALRPLEARAVAERRLAGAYLEGNALYEQANWEEAITKLEEVYQERPDYAGGGAARLLCDTLVASGEAYAEQGNYQLAVEHYRRALEAITSGAALEAGYEAYLEKGNAYAEEGNYELALEQFRKALEITRES